MPKRDPPKKTDSWGRPLFAVNNSQIRIPREIASRLDGRTFVFELTEHGFEYRLHSDEEGLPQWIRDLE